MQRTRLTPESFWARSRSSWLPQGRMETMANHGSGWVRMELLVARTRNDRIPLHLPDSDARHGHRVHREGLRSGQGEISSRALARVSDRSGQVTAFTLQRLEDRGTFFVEPVQRSTRPGVARIPMRIWTSTWSAQGNDEYAVGYG